MFLPGQVDRDLGNNKRLDFDRELGQAFTAHQMDHMKQALEDVGHFDGNFQNMKMDNVIPDGQTNTFQTEKGVVSDWAVSADAPEWIVAQARRSGGENSILKRDNTHTVQTGIQMDEGQINEIGFSQTGAGADGATGMQSDWAVSGDAPDWITSNVVKYDQNAVIHRPQKTQGVKSSFIDDKGNEICDSSVSGDAPGFMVETNRRIDPAMIVHPPRYKQPWHNRDSPRKWSGRHASNESKDHETWTEPKGGVKVDYEQNYSHATSKDTPYFVAQAGNRAIVLGEQNPTSKWIVAGRIVVVVVVGGGLCGSNSFWLFFFFKKRKHVAKKQQTEISNSKNKKRQYYESSRGIRTQSIVVGQSKCDGWVSWSCVFER